MKAKLINLDHYAKPSPLATILYAAFVILITVAMFAAVTLVYTK